MLLESCHRAISSCDMEIWMYLVLSWELIEDRKHSVVSEASKLLASFCGSRHSLRGCKRLDSVRPE